jgi:Carboxypeptidase regulatory-like domain
LGPFFSLSEIIAISLLLANAVHGQTSSTGALRGVTMDSSGAVLPGVMVRLIKSDGIERVPVTSDAAGRFAFLSLLPGTYDLWASKPDFEPVKISHLVVAVTETFRLQLYVRLATRYEGAEVSADPFTIQTDSSALGRVVHKNALSGLPLVTRNFAQIAGLSPGVAVGVFNAGELGIGGTALSQVGTSNDGIFVHGARSYNNNWELDGISVSDLLSSGSASGGIPLPSPDALEEFKVQTGMYDASFGRAVGANVSVVTKSGANDYHGTAFEFLRNNVLNANDFFLNHTGQRRPDLKQNQFGVALGGPVKKNQLLFFGSYQGTRQINGVAAGQARIGCAVSLSEPPITGDRSRASLGRLFAGMRGALGGIAISADGSNINPAALTLLNFKLPGGSFLIPTPQTIDRSQPFARSGFSAFTAPCDFREDQGSGSLDYIASQKSRFAARLFVADTDELITFPGNGRNPAGNIRGFDSPVGSDFVAVSIAHTYTINNDLLNEARFGFVRTATQSQSQAPFKWSDVGVSESEMNSNNELPTLNILGSVSMAPAYPRTYTQNTYSVSDTFSILHGAHALKSGGSLALLHEHFNIPGLTSSLQFLSWPDFLLGLDASDNGTGMFSNVFASTDIFGLLSRDFQAWEGSAFIQDDYRVGRFVTLNLGLRYERLGQFGDKLGRNSSFDMRKAEPNPPANGSFDGYVVASNFSGALPPGVIRASNASGTYAEGQNTIAPRIGFAWQILPTTNRLLLRGGYGIYYSRPTGQASAASITGTPFSLFRVSTGEANAEATFQSPFAQPFPIPNSFPMFVPYSPNTKVTLNTLSPDLRPAMVQQFSLNVQNELREGWLLEVGYVGAHGVHLQRFRSLNQALNASPEDPIRGITSNTVANIGLRVPIPGVVPDSLREMESEGTSWYNGLEASLTKRLSHELQFLAAYTFSKTLDADGANINGTSAGTTLTLGDQNSPGKRWGRTDFDRTHRFVFSTTWTLPSPPTGVPRAVLGGWSLAAIATIQSGSALTITETNSTNVFGISGDRAQLSGTCPKSQLVKGGSVESKLNGYFNASCFTGPPVVGADGIGTAFGNSATGIVDGPGQANLDLALSKTVMVNWPFEKSSFQFRAEFYNTLNHPQFANPDTNFTSPTFGVISSTAVNPRVGQLALRFAF